MYSEAFQERPINLQIIFIALIFLRHKLFEFFLFRSKKLFSEEGTRVAHEIFINLKKSAKSNGRSTCVRGIFYMSPWFRDLVSSSAFR